MSKRTMDHTPALRGSESDNPRSRYVLSLPRPSSPHQILPPRITSRAKQETRTFKNKSPSTLPSLTEQEILRVFPTHQPTVIEILRISSTDLGIPSLNNRAWDLCQVVISSRAASAASTVKTEKLLVGKSVTGAFRAYQSVLRLLSLLPDGVVLEEEGGKGGEAKGRKVLGPRDLGGNGGEEEVCTLCAIIVLGVPRSFSEEMFQGLLVGFE